MIMPVPSSPEPSPSFAVIDTMAGDTFFTIWLIEADVDVEPVTLTGGAAEIAAGDDEPWSTNPLTPAPAAPPARTPTATSAATPKPRREPRLVPAFGGSAGQAGLGDQPPGGGGGVPGGGTAPGVWVGASAGGAAAIGVSAGDDAGGGGSGHAGCGGVTGGEGG